MSEKLREVLAAWESLPQGHYSPHMVQDWLVNKMAPAMQGIRDELARAPAPSDGPGPSSTAYDQSGYAKEAE